ncbi:MAG TPA: LysR family transcriptional regulator [Nocardioidaceae bacterium]
METRRLAVLLELSRLGSMREVAEEMGTTTSTVSQQIATLARESGAQLVERDGRRVRLTPAGRRLAEHAVTILAAVEAARLDLDPHSEPTGTVRVAGFATAVRSWVVPVLHQVAQAHPRVRLLVHEHEPVEAFALLRSDDVDLALTYDYDLAPADIDRSLESTPLWTTRWGLGVPAEDAGVHGDAPQVFARFAERDWIVNSRYTADADVVRTIASMAGFEPRISHRVDSLELVQELVAAGLGVGLLPADQPTRPHVVTLPLTEPEVRLRAYAVVRRGRSSWPPLAVVLARLRATLER